MKKSNIMSSYPMPPKEIYQLIHRGVAIPACPLALDENRKFDESSQRVLIRYYASAGAGGVAVAVHTTQFEIRKPEIGLLEPVLSLASEELDQCAKSQARPLVKVAGVCGGTKQAVKEAELAVSLGYHVGLLSLSALKEATDDELIEHCKSVAEVIPLMGFYLQPAVGGRVLPYTFWKRFCEIDNVVAIKMAPFNRYQTIDVVRAVAESGEDERIALYTGNDDNIINDLLTPFTFQTSEGEKTARIKGGLLGQWSIWTKKAVEVLERVDDLGDNIPSELLRMNAALTDANAVVFDASNGFAGCIPGINEVLRRQGLLKTNLCLNPYEVLSPGQSEEIDRVCMAYPWLTDDDFIREHLEEWKSN